MKQILIVDPEIKYGFINPTHWDLNFKSMRCSEHNSGAGLKIKGTQNEQGNMDIEVILDVCCENFFNQIIEKQKQIITAQKNMKALSNFHEQRAENSEISEMIVVGGKEILEVEIIDLRYSSKEGDYLQLTGNRTLPVIPSEFERVRDFLEYRNDVLGIRRKLNVSGQPVFENEILDVIYDYETPFVKLTDNRLIEVKSVEVDAIMYFVNRNKKLRGEK